MLFVVRCKLKQRNVNQLKIKELFIAEFNNLGNIFYHLNVEIITKNLDLFDVI